jgi:hypothetical protein
MTNITDSLRYAEDQCNAVDCLLSQDQKPVYVITVTGDTTNFDDTGLTRILTSQRITIADGYRAWTASQITGMDGYLYPRVEELTGQALVLAGGQLTDKLFLIGALVLPYNFNGMVGGLDPLPTFQPTSNANIDVYIQVFGLGLPRTVNYYKVKNIVLSGKHIQEGISYKVLCEAANVNIKVP